MDNKPKLVKEEDKEAARSKFMEFVIMGDSKNSTNLNKLFDSFGCNTLEAKVPIVDDSAVENLRNADEQRQKLATLAFKSESAAHAISGRAPRTKNRQVRVMEIAGETVICAGETRERSPVNKCELDSDLDTYMKETARVRTRGSDWPLDEISPNKDEEKDEQQLLDEELEAYKRERLRLRAQKAATAQLSNRFTEREDFDDDHMEF